MRIAWLAVAILLSCLAAAHAEAQDTAQTSTARADAEPETDDGDARARGLFLAGQAAFDRAQFDEALGYFESAYQLSERPQLLFNIGLAAERAGKRARALEAYREYLRETPDARNRPDVEARIAALEPPSVEEEHVRTRPTVSTGPGALPWIVVGAGGAIAIAGGAFLGVGLSDVGAVEGAPLDAAWADYRGRYDRGPLFTTLGWVMLGVGVAGAVVGVVLLTMGAEDERVTLSVGPGGLALRGRF